MQLAVGTRKGLFRWSCDRDDAARWRIVARDFVGEPVTAFFAWPDARDWLVALRTGHFGVKMRSSTDGGATWREANAPAYGAKPRIPEGEDEDPHPWSVDQVWVLEGQDASVANRLWAGTIPGGLFRSDDRGATWALNESLWSNPDRRRWFGGGYDYPGVHSICVSPSDPDDLVVGVSCGGVWRTRDGGATWTVGRGLRAEYLPPEQSADPITQDPHRLIRCRAAPDVLWMQHHNGIWRSRDGGSSWEEIHGATPSRFGFAVAVDPNDPDRAWFVPAKSDACRVPVGSRMSVSVTRDGGRSWSRLERGLAGEECYHLVYRHGLAVSGDGRCMAMGSTTGSLWTSSDGGENWTTLSTSLPPIYAVAFTG